MSFAHDDARRLLQHGPIRAPFRVGLRDAAPTARHLPGRSGVQSDDRSTRLPDGDFSRVATYGAERRPIVAGSELPYRHRLEALLGERLDGIDVRLGAGSRLQRIGAVAATAGDQVVFASTRPTEGEVAHEAAHVLQHRRHPALRGKLSDLGGPRDAAEVEADAAARAVMRDERFSIRQAPTAWIARQEKTPPVAWGSGWFPSQQGPAPGPPPQQCFEDPTAWTSAGAPAGFDKYIALSPSVRQTVLRITYRSGALSKALAALGLRSREPKYADIVRDILRWIEEQETRKATGLNDDEMAKLQAGMIKADPKIAAGGWGGTTATRWGALLEPAKAAWRARATAAITKMVGYAATAAPELKLKEATFEFNPEGVDNTAKFAVATVGSKRGETVKIGFEFVAQVEVNPAYPLQFVVHELFGHVAFDVPGAAPQTYQGQLFQKAAALTPAGTVADPTGAETFDYWSSELYSWLLQIPYFKATATGEAGKAIETPGLKTTVGKANWDPTVMAERWLAKLKSKWESSVAVGLIRGFYKRLANDPAVQKASVTAFEGMVKRVFPKDAAGILK